MSEPATDKRESILKASEELFEANGFHATGVDAIADRAGVTKRTLYKHFGSKEALIEAVLRRHQNRMMDRVQKQAETMKNCGGQRLLACFELYQEWFSKPYFSGCIFIKTLNEFQQNSESLFALAAEAKSALRDYLAEIANDEGVRDPERLADQLQLILEGSIVVAQCSHRKKVIRTAQELAEKIISESIRS